jgi:hypothetical protein
MCPRRDVKSRKHNELFSLIDEFERGWNLYVSNGLLNSEGRKACVRIGSLAGHVFPESPFNVKWLIGDGSDLHLSKALMVIKARLCRA